jgi:hypothetical protein
MELVVDALTVGGEGRPVLFEGHPLKARQHRGVFGVLGGYLFGAYLARYVGQASALLFPRQGEEGGGV